MTGDEVILPCNFKPPSPDDSISLVLWYREDSGNPIYSVDVRNKNPNKAKHFSSELLGSRAFLNLSAQLAHLHIRPVINGDAGEYRCRVDFRRARTMNMAMKLNVIVPPEKIFIFNNENRSIDGLIGPLHEGANINLTCEVQGGNPTPYVTWWRESNLIDDSYRKVESGIVINELIVENLKREDMMSVYTCIASNTNLIKPISASVTIDLNLKPLAVRIINPDEPLSAGTMYEMKCQSTGSRPSVEITWIKGDMKVDIPDENLSRDGENTTSILTFVPSSEDNRKHLLCRAENPDILDSALEDKRIMNVFYAPQLTLAIGANDIYEEIREGASVYFECNIQANPPVTKIKWVYEQKTLLPDLVSGIRIVNNSLWLQGVKKSHKGRYRCTATNSEGEGSSEEITLRVQFAPVCVTEQKTVYKITKYEEVNVTCELEADPRDITFHWKFNTSDEKVEIVTYKNEGTKSTAKYTLSEEQINAELYCFGRNSIGIQLEPCVFTILLTEEEQQQATSSLSLILVGIAGALILLSCIIICIRKARSGDKKNRGTAYSNDNENKISLKVKKEFDDGSPDVIPSENYSTDYADMSSEQDNYEYRYERIYESIDENKEHTYENIISKVNFNDKDATYTELELPNIQQIFMRKIEPPIEYADINLQNNLKIISPPVKKRKENDYVQTQANRNKPSDCTSSIYENDCL